MKQASIDHGRSFDWGKASGAYAEYRDIYPPAFYEHLLARGVCGKGQNALDLGTGTGVLPRALYPYGAKWTGADISENQIAEARRLSEAHGMDIRYIVSSAEALELPDESFDTVTACQCFMYFDNDEAARNICRMLKPGGRLMVIFMAWLPDESEMAAASEKLILKYNPNWTGCGMQRSDAKQPTSTLPYFRLTYKEAYLTPVEFTRESWHGRLTACRGTAASMAPETLAAWEEAHKKLTAAFPERFVIPHWVTLAELTKK